MARFGSGEATWDASVQDLELVDPNSNRTDRSRTSRVVFQLRNILRHKCGRCVILGGIIYTLSLCRTAERDYQANQHGDEY